MHAWLHSERRQVSWPRNLQLHGLDEKSWYRPTNSIYAAPWYGILNRFRKFYNSPNSESEFFAEFEKTVLFTFRYCHLTKIIIPLYSNLLAPIFYSSSHAEQAHRIPAGDIHLLFGYLTKYTFSFSGTRTSNYFYRHLGTKFFYLECIEYATQGHGRGE